MKFILGESINIHLWIGSLLFSNAKGYQSSQTIKLGPKIKQMGRHKRLLEWCSIGGPGDLEDPIYKPIPAEYRCSALADTTLQGRRQLSDW